MNYKRIFLIIIDSLGVGELPDAKKYNDEGANTLKHISVACDGLNLPNLERLGINYITDVKGLKSPLNPLALVSKMKETSVGKDTITGHWELMGLIVDKAFKSFPNGFPDNLIMEIEKQTGYKVIGNIPASGTKIIEDLGKEHLETNAIIIYTSSDSVLQIAVHENVMPIEELYSICEKVRALTLNEEWFVARVIARPFSGNSINGFHRQNHLRHDYAIPPYASTALNHLKNNNLDVISIGKIHDIFDGFGITKAYKSKSSIEGMQQTIDMLQSNFTGLCFTNLVDFDSVYGHRRNPIGYGKALEQFDFQLAYFLEDMQEDDLLIITADHGNDPTHHGTDHTREYVPLIVYAKNIDGKVISDRDTFSDVGATICDNFEVTKPLHGNSFLSLINKK